MVNVVLCFDRLDARPELRDASNATALFGLLDPARQLIWHRATTPGQPLVHRGIPWQTTTVRAARATIVAAYQFLADHRQPGDQIYLLGAGTGAYCARELCALLGTVGLLTDRSDGLRDYLLATSALPGTRRSPQDWQRLSRLTGELTGRREIAVPVRYLGLWDTVTVPNQPPPSTAPLTHAEAGRHARAIDAGPFGVPVCGDTVHEAWFRGAHCDVTGGPGACAPLADIALDWILDGAVTAGLLLADGLGAQAPTPEAFDALAGHAHLMALRTVPPDAAVHASVGMYLRAHPQYRRRLPGRIRWTDADWPARAERLVSATGMADRTGRRPVITTS